MQNEYITVNKIQNTFVILRKKNVQKAMCFIQKMMATLCMTVI